MKKQVFTLDNDGFIGAYYGGPENSKKGMIVVIAVMAVTAIGCFVRDRLELV